ncbi:hypothetical protein MCEMSHM24_03591 [Comamonadaceae bacterium]
MTTEKTSRLITVPDAITREAMDEINTRAKQNKANSPLDRYNRQCLNNSSWYIREQAVKVLPRSLTELISLKLRDQGNALIEETRQLNNQYVGQLFRDVSVQSMADLNFIELRHKILEWAEEAIQAVLYKHRRQFQENPLETYLKHHKGFISYIDQTIAHGDGHLYSIAWSEAMDAMPYWILDRALFQTEKIAFDVFKDTDGIPRFQLNSEDEGLTRNSRQIIVHTNLYGFEPIIYCKRVILEPLLLELQKTQHPEPDGMRRQVNLMMGDILEAAPYLLNKKINAEDLFDVPGASCVGGFQYVSRMGFAQFCFNDSRKLWLEGYERSFYRCYLELDYFGQITFATHPWMTLQRNFSEEDSLLLTYWLLQQIHPQVVREYLSIEQYYLREPTQSPLGQTTPDFNETAYWQKPDVENDSQNLTSDKVVLTEEVRDKGVLKQMRQTRFFKLLNFCGVQVEQGKGSELKLLKDGAHPFRLGSHYGPNPTIPSFMIDSILKRMQITHEQWRVALNAA